MPPSRLALLALLALSWAVLLAACGTEPRGLVWEVEFATGALGDAAARVEARILVGGCDGATAVYDTSIRPGGAIAGMPPTLPPGVYGFSAAAHDDTCTLYASGCEELTLPLDDGATVLTRLRQEVDPMRLCSLDRCVDGECQALPDAGDAAEDAGDTAIDTAPPPLPEVVLAQGAGSLVSADLLVSGAAALLATGGVSVTQTGTRGGWVSSTLTADGAAMGRSLTNRDALVANNLYAASAALFDVAEGARTVGHVVAQSGYTAESERFAYALLSRDRVTTSAATAAGGMASATAAVDGPSFVIVSGWARASAGGGATTASLSLEVNGEACGRTVHGHDGGTASASMDMSFACFGEVTVGPQVVIRARAGGVGFTIDETRVSAAIVPSALVLGAGALVDEPVTIMAERPATLVAFAWSRFAGGGGFADAGLLVDGASCARSRNVEGPSDVTVTCLAPVTPDVSRSLAHTTQTEGPIDHDFSTVRWLLLPAAE